MNYPAAELRGILKVDYYFEKPMFSQTLPYKETSEQSSVEYFDLKPFSWPSCARLSSAAKWPCRIALRRFGKRNSAPLYSSMCKMSSGKKNGISGSEKNWIISIPPSAISAATPNGRPLPRPEYSTTPNSSISSDLSTKTKLPTLIR